MVDVNRVNKYRQTPCDVACSISRDPATKQRICDLFTGTKGQSVCMCKLPSWSAAPAVFYIPVLRAMDNSICPSLLAPCTFEQLEAQKSQFDKKDSPILSSAMAGPMSLSQAKTFHKEWRSPSNSLERKEVKNIKRSDPDRGMERRGR